MASPTPSTRNAAIGLAIGGLTLGIGGELHPHADSGSYHDAMSSMLSNAVWPYAHAIAMAGAVIVAVSLAALLRGVGTQSRRDAQRATRFAIAGTIIAIIELVPHLLSFSEANAFRAGESTPLATLSHDYLDIVSNPAFGFSIAALAVVTARGRELGNGWILAIPAVVGGIMFGVAGPLMAFTHNPAVSPLFAGVVGMAVWLIAAGVRTALAASSPERSAGVSVTG